MKTFSYLFGVLVCGMTFANANILVDGDFSSGAFIGTDARLGGDILDIGGDGYLIDDGWLAAGGQWEITGGEASRTATNKFGSYGFGQIVSNSESYLVGEILTFSFEYNIITDDFDTFEFEVYGITGNGTDNWLTSGGDAVNLVSLGINGGPEPAGNYLFDLEHNGSFVANTPAAGTYSQSFVLDKTYNYFAVAFSADDDDEEGVIIDNVSLAIPEPSSIILVSISATLMLLGIRRKI